MNKPAESWNGDNLTHSVGGHLSAMIPANPQEKRVNAGATSVSKLDSKEEHRAFDKTNPEEFVSYFAIVTSA